MVHYHLTEQELIEILMALVKINLSEVKKS